MKFFFESYFYFQKSYILGGEDPSPMLIVSLLEKGNLPTITY